MKNEDLYQKAEQAINKAFEVTKQSAKTLSGKAGEAAHITQLYVEKVKLEHRVSKKVAELGNHVYRLAKDASSPVTLDDEGTEGLVAQTKTLEEELAGVEAKLNQELKKNPTSKKQTSSDA